MNSKRSIVQTIFLTFAALAIFSCSFAVAQRTFADSTLDCSGTVGATSTQQGAVCLPADPTNASAAFAGKTPEELIVEVIQIMLSVAVVITIFFVILGGYRYIFDGGNDEQAAKGRKTITNALIGLVVIILSFTIVTVVSHSTSNPVRDDTVSTPDPVQ